MGWTVALPPFGPLKPQPSLTPRLCNHSHPACTYVPAARHLVFPMGCNWLPYYVGCDVDRLLEATSDGIHELMFCKWLLVRFKMSTICLHGSLGLSPICELGTYYFLPQALMIVLGEETTG